MRGKLLKWLTLAESRRLIPAHAGKTCQAFEDRLNTGAHPRACGENGATGALPPLSPGSSPRMRGKQVIAPEGGNWGRLIPAHAGKTTF